MTGLTKVAKYIWNHPLNADHRLSAIGRFARWQLASRLLPGPVGLPFVDDTRLFVTRGMTGATGNWYCGLHELQEMAFVLHLLRPGDLFLDAGANIGSYSVLASGVVGARTIAVEPIPATFANLERNLLLNDTGELARYLQIGLSDRPAKLRFTADLDTVNHVMIDGEGGIGIEVDVSTVDEIVGVQTPLLMKIDVEGHELPLLRGASKTLSADDLLAVIMETNNSGARYGNSDHDLFRLMADHGFSAFSYDPFARTLSPATAGTANTIFARDVGRVEERTKFAPRRRLINGTI
jgi:FkbM family methyltransferase